jgi:hypothetical protein
MAAAEKLSVSIHKEELAWARKYAKASGRSLSAVLTEALREQRRARAMDALLEKLRADKIGSEQIAALRAEIYRK